MHSMGLEEAGYLRVYVEAVCLTTCYSRFYPYSLLGGRLVATNWLEEDSSTLLEMQEKKASDEAIHLWWTNSEFSY